MTCIRRWFVLFSILWAVTGCGGGDGGEVAAAGNVHSSGASVEGHDGSRVVVMRVLAEPVEPAMALLTDVRAAWRDVAWGLAAGPPWIWRM